MVIFCEKKGFSLGVEIPPFSDTPKRQTDRIPSGKHTKSELGKSPFGIGKSTVNEPFSIATCKITRWHIFPSSPSVYV
jgi:hypothetical protein